MHRKYSMYGNTLTCYHFVFEFCWWWCDVAERVMEHLRRNTFLSDLLVCMELSYETGYSYDM